jgi:hypothetical protein
VLLWISILYERQHRKIRRRKPTYNPTISAGNR